MRNFKLTLSYDGTNYHGWQIQPNGVTVQQVLEDAIEKLIQVRVHANASGRTDSGVHAIGQVVNFLAETRLEPATMLRGLNFYLPDDVVVRECVEVPLNFDANRSAIRKRYRYVIHDGAVPDVFRRRYSCRSKVRLDAGLMAHASEVLVGTHDFACFETEWPNRASSVRTITHLGVNRVSDFMGDETIWLDVEADGFLYNMVRAIAGTLMNVGRGYWPGERVASILASKDRTQAGPTAPAEGLFLIRVTYADS